MENEEFMAIINYLCPQYKQIGRKTVRDDIVRVLLPQRKEILKTFFQKCITTEDTGFSFTTDIY